MAKIHVVSNNCQNKEIFKVVANYAVSGMSLRSAMERCPSKRMKILCFKESFH